MKYRIVIAPSALLMLETITDRRIKTKLSECIDRLDEDPEKRGKALTGDLAKYRSVRAVGQRYRIIYHASASGQTVEVIAVGIRREGSNEDIYALAKKLIRLRLVPP